MGMPCQVNSILKLNSEQDYPDTLTVGACYQAVKEGYRILPIDVPLCLVDENWLAHADVVVQKLTWQGQKTYLEFRISRCYEVPFSVK